MTDNLNYLRHSLHRIEQACGRNSLLVATLLAMQLGAGSAACQTPFYYGNSLCIDCHRKATAIPQTEAELYKLVDKNSSFLYRKFEQSIWEQCDKHKDAADALITDPKKKKVLDPTTGKASPVNARAKLMQENLDPKRFNTADFTRETKCMSCHGVVVKPDTAVHEDSFASEEQRITSGVSCVACHGPYQEWVNEHAAVVSTWKKLDRAKKKTRGLADLWNPVERAELCASCHVGKAGDPSKGIADRLVTHEMYAAGHPPLPSFEPISFADSMPRHWETLTEKSARLRGTKADYKLWHGFDADVDHREQVEFLLMGALVTARENVRLASDLAREPKRWPEFAVFDCYACHHDLKDKSWRIDRGYKGTPGRPMLRPWADPLFDVALQVLDDGKLAAAGTKPSKALLDELNRQPFGEAGKVREASSAVAQWIDDVIGATQARQRSLMEKKASLYSAQNCRAALDDVFRRADKSLYDFDGSRQLAWAAKALLMELTEGKPPPRPSGKDDPSPPLYSHYKNLWPEELSTAVRELEDFMLLDLPRGQKPIVEHILPAFQRSTTQHEPEEFRKRMKRVKDAWEKAAK